jgi:hypothetical protein
LGHHAEQLGQRVERPGERESNAQRFPHAVEAYNAALIVFNEAKAPHYIKGTEENLSLAKSKRQAKQNSAPK